MPDDPNNFPVLYLRWIAAAAAFALAAVDLYLLGRYGQQGTVSNLLREWGNRWGMFPYIVSFSMGAMFYHLFGPR